MISLKVLLEDIDSFEDPKELIKQFEQALNKFSVFRRNPPSSVDYIVQIRYGYSDFYKSGSVLFLSILRRYSLEPKLRKKIEACSRFYSKSRVNNPKKGEEKEVYEKSLELYREQLELAKQAIETGKIKGSEEDSEVHSLPAGPFTVVNTGGFSEEIMKEVASAVEKANTAIQSKGLSQVCYGDVLVSNTLYKGNTTLAFYMYGNDELFVRANLKKLKDKVDTVATIIHELGHRFENKFMKDKKKMNEMYRKLMHQESQEEEELLKNKSLWPQPGDELKQQSGTYVVTKVGYDKVYLKMKDESNLTGTISLLGWISAPPALKTGASASVSVPKPNSVFVTSYAKTNPSECFAEMFAFYCLGKLPADQVEMFEVVIA